MINSMTGFATKQKIAGDLLLTCDVRSVNHRYLDISVRVHDEYRFLEFPVRSALAETVKRGKIDCRLAVEKKPGESDPIVLNDKLIDRLFEAQDALRAKYPELTPLSFKDILTFPDAQTQKPVDKETLEKAAAELAAEVGADLADMRSREGERLRDNLIEKLDQIENLTKELKYALPRVMDSYQARLRNNLISALENFDEEKFQQDFVNFLQKYDVDEEINRLFSHAAETREILTGKGSAAIGKKLDFLMQEFMREANTLGSKAVDRSVVKTSVQLKVLIEQMREQVQNIE